MNKLLLRELNAKLMDAKAALSDAIVNKAPDAVIVGLREAVHEADAKLVASLF